MHSWPTPAAAMCPKVLLPCAVFDLIEVLLHLQVQMGHGTTHSKHWASNSKHGTSNPISFLRISAFLIWPLPRRSFVLSLTVVLPLLCTPLPLTVLLSSLNSLLHIDTAAPMAHPPHGRSFSLWCPAVEQPAVVGGWGDDWTLGVRLRLWWLGCPSLVVWSLWTRGGVWGRVTLDESYCGGSRNWCKSACCQGEEERKIKDKKYGGGGG